MLEEGELDPNGKLFYTKWEERSGVLGDRKNVIAERDGRSTIYERGIEATLWGEKEMVEGGVPGNYNIWDEGADVGDEGKVWQGPGGRQGFDEGYEGHDQG